MPAGTVTSSISAPPQINASSSKPCCWTKTPCKNEWVVSDAPIMASTTSADTTVVAAPRMSSPPPTNSTIEAYAAARRNRYANLGERCGGAA